MKKVGYYSTVLGLPRVKLEKIEKLRKSINVFQTSGNRDWKSYNLYGLTVEDNGSLQYQQWDGKHYNTDEFALFLADFCLEGERLEYVGEDGTKWGYEFDGEGNVYELIYDCRRGKKL